MMTTTGGAGEGGQLGAILDGGSTAGLGPAELLGRFAATRDEAAFAALVARHGPMVLATCRRVLADRAEADDAFQATFLVLARRAGSVGDPGRLGSWLHRVARRVAARARVAAERRRRAESGGDAADAALAADPADDRADLRAVLDEELDRLPEAQRAPLVLCYLEGLTHDEAAARLAWPVGTVRSRLARGRDRLRSRLARRGVGPAAALPALPAALAPPALVRSATLVALGADAAPARVLTLARGASIAMTLPAWKAPALAAGLALGLAATAAAFALAPRVGPIPAPAAPPPPDAQRPAPQTRPPEPAPVPETSPLTVTGHALNAAGRPVAGARIYLNSVATGFGQRLAETRTDAAGAYRFEAIPLPIHPLAFSDPDRHIEGVFQLLGAADGLAFAWAPAKHVRFGKFELPVDATPTAADDLAPGAPATVDLTFPAPKPLAGRVVDDRGHPLADASVAIVECARPRPGAASPDQVASFHGPDTAPPELKYRRTDADGRFSFDNLPPDLWVELHVQPRGFPARFVVATMTPPARPGPASSSPDVARWDGAPIRVGPVEVVCPAPRDVPVRVVAGDTGRPLPDVRVRIIRQGAPSDFYLQNTDQGVPSDADGRATLRTEPGEYRVVLTPKPGTDYLETEVARVTVPADGAVPPVEATLRAAVVLEATVTDADTGRPIPGVWLRVAGAPEQDKPSPRRGLPSFRWFEAPGRVRSGRPETGPDGTLRALLEPGAQRIGVGMGLPAGGWVPVEPDGVAIDGKPGETIRLSFRMRGFGMEPRPAAPPKPPAPKPEVAPPPLPAEYPLAVTGRARDSDGRPVAGARVVLASVASGDFRRIAEARTDAAGAYRFEGAMLPILPNEFGDRKTPVSGRFEVFGVAEGFGLARRPAKGFARPDPRHVPGPPLDPPDSYGPGDAIDLDLTFPPPATVAGRAVDDRGRPLAGAAVRARSCYRPDAEPTDLVAADQFESFALGIVPPEFRERRTDADGRFAFDGLPPGHHVRVEVAPRGFPVRAVVAATPPLAARPQGPGGDVLAGPLDLAFATPREVAARVVAGDTGRPAPRVRVGVARLGDAGGPAVEAAAATDADGRARLRLPAGEYAFELLPERGTPYLVTEGRFAVPADGPVALPNWALRPAVTLEVAVTDAATGEPVADADLWEQAPPRPDDPLGHRSLLLFRSYEEATQICHVDRPRTGPDGTLRALAEPGPRRVGVGHDSFPGGRLPVERDGTAIDGKPGETIRLNFAMRRGARPGAAPRATPPGPNPAPPPAAPPTTTPFTITGRARDAAGRPVAGARVHLVSFTGDAYRRLAQTRTDAAGAYRFADVPVPVGPDATDGPAHRFGDVHSLRDDHPFRFAGQAADDPTLDLVGSFQVFGEADGLAFAWGRSKHVRFAPSIVTLDGQSGRADDIVHPGQPVAIDLTFLPPRPLAGRVVDDRGRPLADAPVLVRLCGRLTREGGFFHEEFEAFCGPDAIPPALNRRRTDADGRFSFDNFPPGHWAELEVRPRGFPARRVGGAAGSPRPSDYPDLDLPRYAGQRVPTGPIEVVCPTPRAVPIRVVDGVTGRPMAGVFVQLPGAGAATDADGRATIPVDPPTSPVDPTAPRGFFGASPAARPRLEVKLLPRSGTDYLETLLPPLDVPAEGAVAPFELKLWPAVVLEVAVADAATGAPIRGEPVWEDDASERGSPKSKRERLESRSFEAPRTVRTVHPRTGPDGRLRALVAPGPRRVGVGYFRDEGARVAVEPDGVAIDGKPGETIRLACRMRPGEAKGPRP